ncbi:MAG: DUF4097 family beta strand repeat-containing protein [Chloroflexota bacterium]|nr:DUF4097 family beta strand repeat-containing protein [Chloroflexota bacterium]
MTEQTTEVRHRIGRNGRVVLRSVAGSIRVRGTDTDEAVVVARSERGTPPLNVERAEGSLLVEPPRAGLSILGRSAGFREIDIDFDVELPRHARLDLSTVSAELTVEGVFGEQSYKTVSGDVRLADVGGRVSARAVSGDVELHQGGRLELDATTTSGDVTIHAQLLDRLSVRSVSGDVAIAAVLRPGPRHSVETVSGDLELRSAGGVTVELARALDLGRAGRRPIVIGDGAAQLVFRSMSGEADVRAGDGAERPSSAPARPDRLAILRALERGEIDVDEAARQLEEVGADA